MKKNRLLRFIFSGIALLVSHVAFATPILDFTVTGSNGSNGFVVTANGIDTLASPIQTTDASLVVDSFAPFSGSIITFFSPGSLTTSSFFFQFAGAVNSDGDVCIVCQGDTTVGADFSIQPDGSPLLAFTVGPGDLAGDASPSDPVTPTPVPEPSALTLLLVGLLGLGLARKYQTR